MTSRDPNPDALSPLDPGTEPDHSRDQDFINQGSRFMLLDNASKVLEPLLVLVCARLYAGGEWGFFKYYESILLLLARLAVAGMDRGVVWIYARRAGDEAFIRVFSRAVNFVMLFAILLSAFAGLQWAGWLPSWSNFARNAPGATSFNVFFFLLALPFQAGSMLFIQALINKRRLLPILLARNLAMPLVTLSPAILLSFTRFRGYGLAVPYLAGSVFGFALSGIFFARAYRLRWRQWALSASVPRDLFRFSLPLASTDVLMSIAYRVDVILLGRFAGLGAVEVYSVIMMISRTLNSIRQSFDSILLSVFSKGKSGRPTESQVRHYNYASWVVLTLQLPFIPLVLLFGKDLLGLVGPTYASGHYVLAIAVFFNLWVTLGAFSDQFIAGMGKTHIIPFSHLTLFGASVALNFLIIPRFGAEGAAVATGMATLMGGAINFGAIWYYNRRIFLLPEYVRAFGTGVLILLPSLVVGLWIPASFPIRLALLTVSMAVFAGYSRMRWKRFNAAV